MLDFNYEERSLEEQIERTVQKDGRGEGFLKSGHKIFTPKEGSNRFRILPKTWEGGSKHYGYDVWVHYNIGPRNSSYVCPKYMSNEPCPICEELAKSTDKEYINTLKAKKKVLIWVIDRENENEGPKLFAMASTVDKNFVLQSIDEEDGKLLFIDHPVKGYDVAVTRTGTGRTTKWDGEKISRTSKPLSDKQENIETWLQYIIDNPIPSLLVIKDYNYIKTAFYGTILPSTDSKPKQIEENKETVPGLDTDKINDIMSRIKK